jgi:hypothetical protein
MGADCHSRGDAVRIRGGSPRGKREEIPVAKDKLVINEEWGEDVLRIAWLLAEDGDIGATLGDGDRYTQADLNKATPDDRPHILACLTAAKDDGVEHDRRGFYWTTRAKATLALRMINLALKTDGGAPWPEWALKAKAEGWREPKGWRPS